MELGRENQDDLEGECKETQPLIIGKCYGSGEHAQPAEEKVVYSSPLCEWLSVTAGIDILYRNFGHKLLIIMFASQHLMKGFSMALTTNSVQQYLFASYAVPGPQMQIYSGVTQLPWAMKPVFGMISDLLPVGGYNKAPYMIITSMFGVLAAGAIGYIPQSNLGLERVVACIFCMQLQFSTCDLLVEAKYSEQLRSKPQHGPALVSFVWFGLHVGEIFALASAGPVLAHFGAKVPYLISIFPSMFIIIPVVKNYLEEVPKTAAEVEKFRAIICEQKEACILSLLIFVGSTLLMYTGIAFESASLNAAIGLGVAVVMLVAFSVMLRPTIAKVNAFFMIQNCVGIPITGTAFYFFTDTEEMYPDGPHFSAEFMTSVMGAVGAVCACVGILTYKKCASDWTYRSILLSTNLLMSLLSFADIILFTRFNKKLGIPDQAFLVGGSVLGTVISQWSGMPGVLIMSQLCPKGMEATMFALLAGCRNLGSTIAANLGAFVLERVGCVPKGIPNESDQFKNLWVASLLGTVLPMATIILMPWLIPDASQTDKLLDDNDGDATTGSLWRQWTGR